MRFITGMTSKLHFKGKSYRSGGHGFSGLGRMTMLQILQKRARELGVDLHFECNIDSLEQFADAALIIAADGMNSIVRSSYAESFQPTIKNAGLQIYLARHISDL